MNEIMAIWAEWLRPSAGLPTVQWSILLAVAAAAGHLLQRHTGLPKVVGYSLIGALAGLAGFSGAAWPLQGIALFLLELGVSVVLFEAGGRIALRWFRHNPMVLLQSLLESTLTALAVYYAMRWMGVQATVAEAIGLIAMVASPAVLSRVVMDTRASGPVTERAMVLSTLSTLYALTLVSARAGVMHRPHTELGETLYPVAVVLGVSFVVGAALALALRMALRVMSPTSENTSMLLITLIAAATALAAHFGGSAPLAALLGGILLKQLNPRPWAWPRQLGTAASLLIDADVRAGVGGGGQGRLEPGAWPAWSRRWCWRAARPRWSASAPPTGAAAPAGARPSGPAAPCRRCRRWRCCWCTQFVASSLTLGPRIASIALPAILLMEVLGAIIATFAIYRAGESSRPLPTEGLPNTPPGELRG